MRHLHKILEVHLFLIFLLHHYCNISKSQKTKNNSICFLIHMYQYISCIRRILIPQNVLNILTTVLHSLPVNIVFISLVGKIDIGHVRLNFWDLGGQEELQSLWDKVRMWIMLGGGFCFLWDKVKYVEAILILYLSSLWKWDICALPGRGKFEQPIQ